MMPTWTPITFEFGAAKAAAAGRAANASLPKSLLFRTMTGNYTGFPRLEKKLLALLLSAIP
jgi:hypothetical protein